MRNFVIYIITSIFLLLCSATLAQRIDVNIQPLPVTDKVQFAYVSKYAPNILVLPILPDSFKLKSRAGKYKTLNLIKNDGDSTPMFYPGQYCYVFGKLDETRFTEILMHYTDGFQSHKCIYKITNDPTKGYLQPKPKSGFWDPNVAENWLNRYTSSKAATVKLIAKFRDGSTEEGTALIVSKDGLLITCDHVISRYINGQREVAEAITFKYGDNDYPVETVFLDPKWSDQDIAILECKPKTKIKFPTVWIPIDPNVDRFDEKIMLPGREANLLGWPIFGKHGLDTLRAVIGTNKISAVQVVKNEHTYTVYAPMMLDLTTLPELPELQTQAMNGMSGGALLSSNGYVLGLYEAEQSGGIEYCIPFLTLRNALYSIDPPANRRFSPKNRKGNSEIYAIKGTDGWKDFVRGLQSENPSQALDYYIAALKNSKDGDAHRLILIKIKESFGAQAKALEWLRQSLDPATALYRKDAPTFIADLISIAADSDLLSPSILIKALDNPDSHVVEAALYALQGRKDINRVAADEFDAVFRCGDKLDLRAQAYITLGKLIFNAPGRWKDPNHSEIPDKTPQKWNQPWIKSVKIFITDAFNNNDHDQDFRTASVILQNFDDQDADDDILKWIGDVAKAPGNETRAEKLTYALYLTKSTEKLKAGIPILKELLTRYWFSDRQEKTNNIRNRTMEVISRISSSEAADTLKTILEDQKSGSAAVYLYRMGTPRAFENLRTAFAWLKGKSQNSRYRRLEIVSLLAANSSKNTTDDLVKLIIASDPDKDDEIHEVLQKKLKGKPQDNYREIADALTLRGFRTDDIFQQGPP